MSHVYLGTMRLHTIHTGNKLDGGAMFRWCSSNLGETNRLMPKIWHGPCVLCWWKSAMPGACGLWHWGQQSEKFFSHYHLHGDHSLDRSLNAQALHVRTSPTCS